MEKTILRCPHCKGQHLSIAHPVVYNQNYIIEDNKVFLSKDGPVHPVDTIWISCIDCLQEENIQDPSWQPTEEEKKVILDIITEPRYANITEYMEE